MKPQRIYGLGPLVSLAVFVSICLAFAYSTSVVAVHRGAERRGALTSPEIKVLVSRLNFFCDYLMQPLSQEWVVIQKHPLALFIRNVKMWSRQLCG